MILKGRVNIVAKPGMRLQIPDGVVLHDKVNQWCYQILSGFLSSFKKNGTFGCRVGWLSFLSLLYRMKTLLCFSIQDIRDPKDIWGVKSCFDKLQRIFLIEYAAGTSSFRAVIAALDTAGVVHIALLASAEDLKSTKPNKRHGRYVLRS